MGKGKRERRYTCCACRLALAFLRFPSRTCDLQPAQKFPLIFPSRFPAIMHTEITSERERQTDRQKDRQRQTERGRDVRVCVYGVCVCVCARARSETFKAMR